MMNCSVDDNSNIYLLHKDTYKMSFNAQNMKETQKNSNNKRITMGFHNY